ncbi:pimeloyl-ACP methyl ester carboxylesterase [Sphingomonas zeicaulis]|uniref:esterase/lipase family protein n=1 Tax=Sphingomonas zeicaulis TaxID=1632740 RepID=UPI003D227936
MTATPPRGSVILLHGIWALPVMMAPMEWALRRRGYRTFNPMYRSRAHSVDRIVAALHPRFERFAAANPGPIHFVTHSMGSLVLRAYVTRHRPAWIGRAVMLGPPHAGSPWVDLARGLRVSGLCLGPSADLLDRRRNALLESALGAIDFPVGIIAGTRSILPFVTSRLMGEPNDGKVAVSATHLPGQSDHIVLPVGHSAMPHDRETIRQTLAFLERERFDRADADDEQHAIARRA